MNIIPIEVNVVLKLVGFLGQHSRVQSFHFLSAVLVGTSIFTKGPLAYRLFDWSGNTKVNEHPFVPGVAIHDVVGFDVAVRDAQLMERRKLFEERQSICRSK